MPQSNAPKVIRLRKSQCDSVIEDILQASMDDKLDALIIMSKSGQTLRRYWFDKNELCIYSLGLCEEMKHYILNYMDEHADEEEEG